MNAGSGADSKPLFETEDSQDSEKGEVEVRGDDKLLQGAVHEVLRGAPNQSMLDESTVTLLSSNRL